VGEYEVKLDPKLTEVTLAYIRLVEEELLELGKAEREFLLALEKV
jgi:hypothetical protein